VCLAIPMRLIERDDHSGVVELHGVKRRVSLMLFPEAQLGDHLLVHAGYAISVVDADEAAETVAMLEQMAELEAAQDPPTENEP